MDRLVFDAYKTKDVILKSLDIVKQFIIDHKLLLTGGMAIDMALKSIGEEGIYKDELPDYDFYSPTFYKHSYELGQKLCQAGMPNVTVINALHVVTMRIRTDFDVVGDLTYMNPSIFEKMPYLEIEGMRVIHPHFIMATQFLSLARTFDNYPREIIFHRSKKDIIRCNLLDKAFPVPPGKAPKMTTVTFSLKEFGSVCLSGWTALAYWSGKLKRIGDLKFEVEIPEGRDVEILSESIDKLDLSKASGWRSGYLDIVPRSFVLDNIRVFDSFGYKISAHQDEVYICNMQYVLCQLICEVLFLDNDDISKADETRYGYNKARELLIEGIAAGKKELMPSINMYGVHSLSANFFIGAVRFLHEAEVPNIDLNKFQLPSMHAFSQCVIPEKLLEYDAQSCEFYKNDYQETTPFEPLQLILQKLQ